MATGSAPPPDLRLMHSACHLRALEWSPADLAAITAGLTSEQRDAVVEVKAGSHVLGATLAAFAEESDRPWRSANALGADADQPPTHLVQLFPGAVIEVGAQRFSRMFEPAILGREIRLFLSSTFRDMQDERDYLMVQVFPQVRSHCEHLGLRFSEVDLRWGITEQEAAEGSVPALCLQEIALSRDSLPFFIGFLGERYGWVPNDTALRQALSGQDNEVQQSALRLLEQPERALLSVTELEFAAGPLLNLHGRQNSMLYLRAPGLTEEIATASGTPQQFYDDEAKAAQQLRVLKNTLRQAGQVRLDGYASIAAFGEDVRAVLMAAASQLHKALGEPAPEQLIARRFGTAAIVRPDVKAGLDAFLAAPGSGAPLLLFGAEGVGKSTALCSWLATLPADTRYVAHYFGQQGDHDMTAMMRKVLLALDCGADQLGHWEQRMYLQQVDYFGSWLQQTDRPMLLVLDGLDHVEEEARGLGWLPAALSPTLRLVCSSSDPTQRDRLARSDAAVHDMAGWTPRQATDYIAAYLATFGKRLSPAQTASCAQALLAGQPRYLRLILDELRYGALHEELDSRIAAYAACSQLAQAYLLTLEHWQSKLDEAGLRPQFRDMLQVLACAREGIEEPELQSMLKLSRLDLARVLAMAHAHFDRLDGRICLPDQASRQAIARLCWTGLDDETAFRQRFVRMLPDASDFFFSRELVYQLLHTLVSGGLAGYPAQLAFAVQQLTPLLTLLKVTLRVPVDLVRLWQYLGRQGGQQALDLAWAEAAQASDASGIMASILPWLLGFNAAPGASVAMARRLLQLAATEECDPRAIWQIRLWLVNALGNVSEHVTEAIGIAEELKDELEFDAAPETRATLANLYFRLGTALANHGQLDEAIQIVRLSTDEWMRMSLSPAFDGNAIMGCAHAHQRLGQLLRDTGDSKEAIAKLEFSRKLLVASVGASFPATAIVTIELAELQAQAGLVDRALPLLREGILVLEGLDPTIFGAELAQGRRALQLAQRGSQVPAGPARVSSITLAQPRRSEPPAHRPAAAAKRAPRRRRKSLLQRIWSSVTNISW